MGDWGMVLLRGVLTHRRSIPGWILPAAWFACMALMMMLTFELDRWMQNVVFAWTGWSILWAMGFVGTYVIGRDAARNLVRFGLRGALRPRFHFELARLCVAGSFLLFVPAVTCGLFLADLNLPFQPLTFGQVMLAVRALLMVFCAAAMSGYMLSWITRKQRRGRAYECTSMLFCIGGGIVLVTFGYIAVPDPPQAVREILPGAIVCLAGVLLITVGVVSEYGRAKREERCHAAGDARTGDDAQELISKTS